MASIVSTFWYMVVGHAGLAVGPVLDDRLHNGAHGEEGGRRGNAGIGINAFLSVFIHSVDYKKPICISLYCTNQSLSRRSTYILGMAAIFFSTFW